MTLAEELKVASSQFLLDWQTELGRIVQVMSTNETVVQSSYMRMASLQAWKTEFFEATMPMHALAFYVEAQNDAVLSQVLAMQGLCRSSLQAMRSCVENVYGMIYYQDHPIELEQWMQGKHRMDRSEYSSYIKKHPRLQGKLVEDCGVVALDNLYILLNHAVHASSVGFRMAMNPPSLTIAVDDHVRFKKWNTSHSHLISEINMLLLSIYGNKIAGAAKLGLKRAIYLSLSPRQRTISHRVHGVVLPSPR